MIPPVQVFAAFLVLASLAGGHAQSEPPRDTKLVEIDRGQVPQEGISERGQSALKIFPDKWKAAETPHFYLHYRRATEARKVAREIEYNLAFVVRQLGATPAQVAKKSHIYVFEDAAEWEGFLSKTGMPPWMSSFAYGDELFLNVRGKDSGDFDSQTLAHETTHAVIARIYRERRWPVWLNEGFSEYMGSAAVADRKNQLLKRFQNKLEQADMTLEELVALDKYPEDLRDIARLYRTGEKLVRFLMSKGSNQQFVALVDALIDGQTLEQAIATNYAKEFPDFDMFEAGFNSFQSK